MKISVITVCFNSAKTILNTISSVESQSYKNIEHLIIDGGSSDGTIELLKKARGNIKYISEPDKGIYDAMNKGLLLATGEVIVFLNADDFYKNKFVVEKVMKEFDKSNLSAVYGDVDFFAPNDIKKSVRRYSSKIFAPKKLAFGFMPAHPSLFMRREVYEKVGGFDINFRIAGDFDLVARAFKNEDLHYKYIPEVFVSMQTGGVSTQGFKSTIFLNREIMQSCLKNNIKTSWVKLISRYLIKIIEFIRV
ncbi:glycosyltransferase family 2 protein [Candidatus Methylopumilus turicensis]|uniref:Glycosyltransferase 2-like domain-containing protein n=1 Tax=Candidatus Methylopumilus turicensis TaxID=1581680 RepID=A0A0B7IZZ4_9PROT|nr:glycosyltransferase family 2 protein [Candidatus Methylopumilus turicensis]CEN55992.1 conserved protein of unknown function [Candidatus Methylopumilus turicensis]